MMPVHENLITKSLNGRDSLPWFVEFVGPGCSGKTTLLKCLKSLYSHEFSYIGPPVVTRLSRVRVRLREELFSRRVFDAYQLDAFSKGRLIKGFAKVKGALGWYATCHGSIFLVDEGPLRVIMDYATHDETQYQIWRRFCIKTLEDLARYRVLVVFVEADPSIRIEWGKIRRGVSKMGATSEDYPVPVDDVELPLKRWFFREEAISLLETGKFDNIHSVSLVNDTHLEKVALRARNIIHEVVTRER